MVVVNQEQRGSQLSWRAPGWCNVTSSVNRWCGNSVVRQRPIFFQLNQEGRDHCTVSNDLVLRPCPWSKSSKLTRNSPSGLKVHRGLLMGRFMTGGFSVPSLLRKPTCTVSMGLCPAGCQGFPWRCHCGDPLPTADTVQWTPEIADGAGLSCNMMISPIHNDKAESL